MYLSVLGRWLGSGTGAYWADGLLRLPLSTEEIKGLIQERVEKGEIKATGRLAGLGSSSAAITMYLGVTRNVIKKALAQLSHDRHLQVTVTSNLGATRFKMFGVGRVYYANPAFSGEAAQKSLSPGKMRLLLTSVGGC